MTYPLPPGNPLASLFAFSYWESKWTPQSGQTLALAFGVCAGLAAVGYRHAVRQSRRLMIAGLLIFSLMGCRSPRMFCDKRTTGCDEDPPRPPECWGWTCESGSASQAP
jgi:hypothetical protein